MSTTQRNPITNSVTKYYKTSQYFWALIGSSLGKKHNKYLNNTAKKL